MARLPRLPRALLPLLVALSLLAAACATATTPSPNTTTAPSPSPTTTPAPTPTATPAPSEASYPVTIQAANGPVRIEKRPERIVSLSPTATEILFAVGAGSQVAAVDQFSNYPPEAPVTDLSGYEPNVEAIAGFDPDLVVISNDPGNLETSLEKLQIPVLLQPAAQRLDDTYAQIEQLGAATGHAAEATQLVADMKAAIDRLVREAPRFPEPRSFYHELDPTYYSVTSKTFIGQIYRLVGLKNVADEATGGAPDYPQLSAEFIVAADPDLIFLADTKCCGQSAATVAERPGWDKITAVKTGAVIALDDDIASRWGPRVVDFLRTVVDALSKLDGATSSLPTLVAVGS